MENLEEVRKNKDNATFTLPDTLNKYISKHVAWNSSDKSSLSYIASRCGILFEVISERYKNIADAQEIYNMSLMNAVIFSRASSDIYKTRCINYACIKEEKIIAQEREKKWALMYEEEAVKNIDLYGKIIHGDIKSDFSTCMIKVKPVLK
tara:strand:- start:58 stop:507 length:450 start_codon:yes stop_codon:yes gene_type:complete